MKDFVVDSDADEEEMEESEEMESEEEEEEGEKRRDARRARLTLTRRYTPRCHRSFLLLASSSAHPHRT